MVQERHGRPVRRVPLHPHGIIGRADLGNLADPCELTYSDEVPLIEVLSQVREPDAPEICSRISHEVALAIGAQPEAVWVTWATYDHGHGVPGRLVHVHGRRTADQMEALTAVLERILGDDVFITVTPVWAIDRDA